MVVPRAVAEELRPAADPRLTRGVSGPAESGRSLPNGQIVRWGQGPLDFEMEAADEHILAHARHVFAPWPSDASRSVAARWRVVARDHVFSVESGGTPAEENVQIAESAERAVAMVEFAAVASILESEANVLGIHAALLSRAGRGVVIVGPSAAGKSTLACALWQSGWSFLTDDATIVIDAAAYPSPRRVSLRRESRDILGTELWRRLEATPSYAVTEKGCLFHPRDLNRGETVASTSLSAIVFLARRGVAGPPKPGRPMKPAPMAMALLPYTNLSRRLAFPKALGAVATLAEQVPGFDLGRAPLAQMVSGVEKLAGLQT